LAGNRLRTEPSYENEEYQNRQHDDRQRPTDRHADAAQSVGGTPQRNREQYSGEYDKIDPQRQPQEQYGDPEEGRVGEGARSSHRQLQSPVITGNPEAQARRTQGGCDLRPEIRCSGK